MSRTKIKRALISVYDKTGLVDFAGQLVEQCGVEIISTGGTAKLLTENSIAVTPVEEVTEFPEMMDGRVKTLHPRIHAALLADRDNPEHVHQLQSQDIKPIDLVVVNLYPFGKTIADPRCTLEQAMEMIDIGGPCMLRAAAKNHKHVLVVDSPCRYDAVLKAIKANRGEKDNRTDLDNLALAGACSVFQHTCRYDQVIARWLETQGPDTVASPSQTIELGDPRPLRYGENPHQTAHLFAMTPSDKNAELATVPTAGDSATPMSFNNYVDASAALQLCRELHHHAASDASCVFVKHTNACGVGCASTPLEAYTKAYLGDPHAAMGGILACSFCVDRGFTEAVMETYDRWGKAAGVGGFFLEVWLAPGFEDAALELIRRKKKWGQRVRLLPVGHASTQHPHSATDYKKIAGGMLIQDADHLGLNESQWQVVTKRHPSDRELTDLRLAWLICKHTKSNAITISKDRRLIGNGAGQMSRVMSCRLATWLAVDNGHEADLSGAVAASDAFFPFSDGPGILIDAGVSAIIQPGGAKRDADVIDTCNKHNVAMICTGTRHFRH